MINPLLDLHACHTVSQMHVRDEVLRVSVLSCSVRQAFTDQLLAYHIAYHPKAPFTHNVKLGHLV